MIDSSASMSYSKSNYNNVIAPSWISINSNGELTISTPSVSVATDFYIYLVSTSSAIPNPINKKIQLRVNKWKVDNCSKCDSTNANKCSLWDNGYSLSEGTWVKHISDTVKALLILTYVVVGTYIVAAIFLSFFATSSFSIVWQMINQLQIIIILLFAHSNLPNDVIDFIVGWSFAVLIYNIIPIIELPIFKELKEQIDFKQNNSVLNMIGISSGNWIINNFSFILLILITILLHIVILFIEKTTCFIREGKWRKLKMIINLILSRILSFLTFGYYLRLLMQSFQNILMTSISEISYMDASSFSKAISLVFAFILLLIYFIFLLFTTFCAFTRASLELDKNSKVKELFADLKTSKKARCYSVLILLRRLIIFILLIWIQYQSYAGPVSILFCIQVFYLAYIVLVRPYNNFKSNFIEIWNEWFFLYYISWLFYFNEEERWTSSFTKFYLSALVSNNLFLFVYTFIQKIFFWYVIKFA